MCARPSSGWSCLGRPTHPLKAPPPPVIVEEEGPNQEEIEQEYNLNQAFWEGYGVGLAAQVLPDAADIDDEYDDNDDMDIVYELIVVDDDDHVELTR
jgi:hypothetical protein